jgi:hypothetical protein
MKYISLLSPLLLVLICLSEASVFQNPNFKTTYSPLILEKNASNDSLIPKLNGDKALLELLRLNPEFWNLESMDKSFKLKTTLNVTLEYIDGTREDQYCDIQESDSTSALNWQIKMGLDFNSGASNTVVDRVRSCLQMARENLGVAVEREGKIVVLAPQDIAKAGEEYRINATLTPELRNEVVKIHEEVQLKGSCPTTLKSYLMLLKLYEQVQNSVPDLLQLDLDLNKEKNGQKEIQSCAYSREWNKLYAEKFSLSCNADKESCETSFEKEGSRTWFQSDDAKSLIFDGIRPLGLFGIGAQSVRSGGQVLDLKLIPLTKDLYLLAYINQNNKPVSLGFLALDGSLKADVKVQEIEEKSNE